VRKVSVDMSFGAAPRLGALASDRAGQSGPLKPGLLEWGFCTAAPKIHLDFTCSDSRNYSPQMFERCFLLIQFHRALGTEALSRVSPDAFHHFHVLSPAGGAPFRADLPRQGVPHPSRREGACRGSKERPVLTKSIPPAVVRRAERCQAPLDLINLVTY